MANHGSDARKNQEQRRESMGCFVWGVLLAVLFGVIALFPWARQFDMTVYPNINGIYVSIAVTVMAGLVFMVLYPLRGVIPWITRLALSLAAGALLIWLAFAILDWLYRMELG